jgi:hypothetical protein
VLTVSAMGRGTAFERRDPLFEPLFSPRNRRTSPATAYGIEKQQGSDIHVPKTHQGRVFRAYLQEVNRDRVDLGAASKGLKLKRISIDTAKTGC